MLPIYKAVAVDLVAIHSGSTKPCMMTLEDEAGNLKGQFVVKVFKPNSLEQGSNTVKEVYGSILASAFDLNTPTPVLVTVNQEIIDILNQKRIDKLMPGTYFATEYIENSLDYSPGKSLNIDDWQIENIFAFDVLIRNVDRHKKKPNLFFKDRDIYLIDHELSLASPFLDKSFPDMLKEKEKYWKFVEFQNDDGFERKHLFLEYLRERNKINPVDFDTFAEYLRNLDVDVLDNYRRQLEGLGNDTKGYSTQKTYLTEVKNKSGLFIQLLKDLIS